MVPYRDLITRKLVGRFLSIIAVYGLTVLEEHTLVVQDDWDEDDDGESSVECWWAVFGRV